MTNILIIGDPHAKPGVSNERFTILGKLIADRKPDVIVNIGDFFDFPSLSSFDVGKKDFEGRRYKLDLEAGHDAIKRIQAPIDALNKELKAKKVKQYNPKKYALIGNHEQRLIRAINSDAKLEGTIGLADLRFEEFGWEVIPFLEPLDVEGITFQHYFTSGAMERAIGGENVGKAILKRYHKSCFQGHNHFFQIAVEADALGNQYMAGSIGCYFEHLESYLSRQTQYNFWRGVVLLNGVENGSVKHGYEAITLDYMKKTYK